MKREFPQNGYDPTTGDWNDSLKGDFLWSNVNVSEAVPDVMTPSTWSLWWIYHYGANPFMFPGNFPFCGNICGRPYLNLSLLVSLYKSVGKDIHKELQADMIGSAPESLTVPLIPFSPFLVLWTALPGLLLAQQYASRDQRKIPGFIAMTQGWCRRKCLQIENIPGKDRLVLLALWREEIKPYFLEACRLLRSVTMQFSDPATQLRLNLTRLVGKADANTILSNLSGSSADLESLRPLICLAHVARGDMSREAYLERYGHRGPHEMELFATGSEEDPDWLDKRLAEFIQSRVTVEELLAKQRAEYAAAWQRFETRYPHKASVIQRQLDKVAIAARGREAVRSEVTRMTRLIRRFVQRAGELIGLGDGIFFLSLDEITAVLSGDETSLGYIPARRETYTRYTSLPPYPAIIIGRFDPFQWFADPNRRSDCFDSHGSTLTKTPITITGFAGAAGCVEGIVRYVGCPEEGNLLQPGEILVTVTTNVGWTPLFPRAAAIITDVGATLSHAAIVARELGIPAVVGCGNATMQLKTGDRVRVDGGRGVVEILDQDHLLG